ncbi:DMT family transporter [Mesorhizobium sp. M2D.F.Ca.ET.185.01.1.1]|uniref:EamA family transporter n=2 Tax=Mesorhizobium TaxID=68287 RepID=UPI000FCA21BB|nr:MULTISPECIES: DMT family transporter [unclassified Mesorhizobium]TGP49290.1 DMT family transporter [bacterium M00.F.Ca.ET.230.01.1.1]TGP80382.1 DMT family transporter [bacterium M00.F.Ca.ET.227.01.1.1]TGQ00649.1 DMT family transporter [bacterium M00.F.Ca.ET.221.01.1.1]TGQ02829.1 DMT family transporter [bacterium M00.F.Ca.ET.222.01.1.1]TGU01600.1 DMT family transporter [bacterium M00.F.Ca.ET.163.01.1.1]TGU32455.1 DMT family transporter [bacterium M00.F.Ca.ET.156.01.1.1]TGU44770.1 DMT famil
MSNQTQIPAANQASGGTGTARPAPAGLAGLADALPPHAWFCVSAVFHYLGPAFAVLLFDQVGVLGMAWLRIATAALIFAPLTKPWRVFAGADRAQRLLLLAFGACLAVMNCSFYLALDRLPISLVAAIEFVGTIAVALVGLRSRRNFAALAIAVAGTLLLIDVRWSSDPVGLFWAFLNGALFVGYIVIGHRVARTGIGIAGLGTAMAIAFLVVLPIGFSEALPAFSSPQLLIAAIGVGVCSSVIPYICDQLAMARLPRASFALMLSLLPLTATLIGVVVLRQVPVVTDCLGVALVIAGVAMHKPAANT